MDHPTTSTLLTWMTFIPLLGSAVILALLGLRSSGVFKKQQVDQLSRYVALAGSGIPLLMGLYVWKIFDPVRPDVQLVHHFKWIPSYNIEYFLGIDGISVTLVILSVLVSFEIGRAHV